MPTTELKSQVGGLAHGPNTISTILLIELKILTIILLYYCVFKAFNSNRKGKVWQTDFLLENLQFFRPFMKFLVKLLASMVVVVGLVGWSWTST